MTRRSLLGLIVSLGVTLGVAYAGSIVTSTSIDGWYREISKPALTPPDWVFPVVWTALFVLMGVAARMVWNRAGWARARTALLVFGIQLLLNFTWSVLFFGLERPGAAVLEVVVLWAAILATLILFARWSRAAAGLLVPYLAWVTFAAYLNLEVWRLQG